MRLRSEPTFRLVSQFWLFFPARAAAACLLLGSAMLFVVDRNLLRALAVPVWVALSALLLAAVKLVMVPMLKLSDETAWDDEANYFGLCLLCTAGVAWSQSWAVAIPLRAKAPPRACVCACLPYACVCV